MLKRNQYLDSSMKVSKEAVDSLKRCSEAGIDPEQLFATVTSKERKKAWAEKHGLTESRGATTLKKFLGKDPGRKYPPGADHKSIWNKDGKPYAYVMQPYSLGWTDLKALVDFCEQHGLDMSMDAQSSWDYPGRTMLIVLTKKAKITS
ncbi:hypothetical protein [Dethiobacter alkaliphilus]|uniref:Uncharacterized protein n=1 Tax=Dethiobacter alkaliphilus AHT 1 TaxID=555088 RepID=C0GE74_DETAL|nr:hypothetical protein [Dethiobacter alkaliphilus]EEG78368.1 hypothetical protein DealDRAFT_0783 [Dethiobacter alkaliphilus AHT 1]